RPRHTLAIMIASSDAVTVTLPRSTVGGILALSAELIDRMHELLELNTNGALRPVEKAELETLVQLAHFSQTVSMAPDGAPPAAAGLERTFHHARRGRHRRKSADRTRHRGGTGDERLDPHDRATPATHSGKPDALNRSTPVMDHPPPLPPNGTLNPRISPSR